MQIIIDELEVDCTPENPDWRALFLAHTVQVLTSDATFAGTNRRGLPRCSSNLPETLSSSANKAPPNVQRHPRSQATVLPRRRDESEALAQGDSKRKGKSTCNEEICGRC